MNVLVIGRNQRRVDRQIKEIQPEFEDSFTFFGANSHVSMREVFGSANIDIVIMSGGHEATEKSHFVDYIINESPGTTIHIKDSDSSHEGMVPFVRTILSCMLSGDMAHQRVASL